MKKINYSFRTIFILCSLLLITSARTANACNANFTYTGACAGDTVWFNAQDQFAVYTWDFGDSTSQVNINHDTATAHVYNTPGVYYVTLFVNIGAEWDYQTQIITIGTYCFHADFDTRCGGSNYIYFTDMSVGSHTIDWNFGDPASGANNISNASGPYHLFTASGNYSVRLIINNGTMADTMIKIVNVPVNCISASIYYNIGGNCLADSTNMAVYYSGTITSYNWNFGDPASGSANTSTLAQPKHLFSGLGMYDVRLIYSNGITTDTIHSIQTIIDCTVWPGDCNTDGEVNADDIFPIGMFYGNHGPARSGGSSAYTSQPETDWAGFNNLMYLQTMVNAKHADCNGDSTINNADLSVVNANYGMRHNTQNNVSGMPEATIADPDMYIQFTSAGASAGSIVNATIYLGTSVKPIPNLYGYSFTVNYDPSLVVSGSVSINLSTNWLGNSSNELMVTHDDYANGKIDAGVVRYDKVQIQNGFGAIGTVTFQLKPTATGTLNTYLSTSAKALSTTQFGGTTSGTIEVFKPINLIPDDLMINALGVKENDIDNSISVYPNPAVNFVNINSKGAEIQEIRITNSLGQLVYSEKGSLTSSTDINLSGFSKGIYSLSCFTKEGMSVKKVCVK